MKRFQRTLTAALAASALIGAFSISANAQTAPAPVAAATHAAPHEGPRAKPVDMAQRHAQHSEHLKTILQLQPNQQAAWDKYVQATTPTPRAKPAADGPDVRKLTTPERLDMAQKLRKERTAQAEQREQATRSFYASLNASQQKAFDAVSQRHSGKHHGGPGSERMGHRHAPQHGQVPHGTANHSKTPSAPAV